jgi:site-specific recombinase XerD
VGRVVEPVPGWDAIPEWGGVGVDVSTLASRYLRERVGRREIGRSSAATYNYALWRFAAYLGHPDVGRVRRHHLERWLAHRLTQVGPTTAGRELSTLRSFFRWLLLNRHIRTDPTVGVAAPRRPRHLPRNLAAAAVGAILAACPDVRGEAMVSLMVQEGLRCMEVAGLEVGDIDTERRLVRVRGKGDRERVVPLTAGTWAVIGRYLDDHPTSAGPLIRSYTQPTRGLAPRTISVLVARWMADAGVKRRPRDGRSAHALRHTCATDVLDGGADIREVKELLGHASLSSTQVYLGWQVQNLRAAMEGRDYRNGGLQNGHAPADGRGRPRPGEPDRIPARPGSRD